MNKILTIVIPSYNTERYIDDCLPTLVNCTEKEELELLLIDDGSTDSTLEKLREYEEKYPSIVRVIHKENGGHGSVINCGIFEASGKYFKVIDGDDWVETSNLDLLISKLKKCNEDMIINPYIAHSESDGKEKLKTYANGTISVGKSMSLDDYIALGGEAAIHSVTFKTSILKENEVSVREKCFYEDTEYFLYPLIYIKQVVFFDFPVYIYRVGTLTQSVNPKQALKNRAMHRLIVLDCIEYYQEKKKNMTETVRGYYEKVILSRVNTQYNIYLKNKLDKEHINELIFWDKELEEKSIVFYEKSNVIPVSILRKNIRFFASIICNLCRLYLFIRK